MWHSFWFAFGWLASWLSWHLEQNCMSLNEKMWQCLETLVACFPMICDMSKIIIIITFLVLLSLVPLLLCFNTRNSCFPCFYFQSHFLFVPFSLVYSYFDIGIIFIYCIILYNLLVLLFLKCSAINWGVFLVYWVVYFLSFSSAAKNLPNEKNMRNSWHLENLL